MLLVIDNTKLEIVKATKVYDSARYWAAILCKGDYRIQTDERRSFAAYSAEELIEIYENTTGQKVPKGDRENYAKLILLCADASRDLPQDDTTPAALAKKLGRKLDLLPGEREVAPEDEGRIKTSPAAPETSGDAQDGSLRPRRNDGVSRTGPVSRMLGKTARPPAKLHDRPKGGKTGKVWDIADKIAGKMPNADKKTLRKAVLDECAKQDCNPAMAATQYSRWYNAREAQKA